MSRRNFGIARVYQVGQGRAADREGGQLLAENKELLHIISQLEAILEQKDKSYSKIYERLEVVQEERDLLAAFLEETSVAIGLKTSRRLPRKIPLKEQVRVVGEGIMELWEGRSNAEGALVQAEEELERVQKKLEEKNQLSEGLKTLGEATRKRLEADLAVSKQRTEELEGWRESLEVLGEFFGRLSDLLLEMPSVPTDGQSVATCQLLSQIFTSNPPAKWKLQQRDLEAIISRMEAFIFRSKSEVRETELISEDFETLVTTKRADSITKLPDLRPHLLPASKQLGSCPTPTPPSETSTRVPVFYVPKNVDQEILLLLK